MALQIVRKRLVDRLTPERTGTGWINMVDSNRGVYVLVDSGVWRITVTGKNAAGVYVSNWGDWGTPGTGVVVAESTDQKNLSVTVVVDLGKLARIVVRALNPIESSEVLMTAEKLAPPPLS